LDFCPEKEQTSYNPNMASIEYFPAPAICNVKQQKASHNTEVFVKDFHAVDFIRTRHCPIVMGNERSSQRV
jgi:hypothetical protein